MSEITDWIKYDLYPAVYESIDSVLPEHNFKPYPGGWRSKTYLDGSPHKDRADKTVVSKKAPGRILEQGGESMSLVDYVMRRDKVDFIEAVKTLANKVGLQLPKGDLNGYKKQNNTIRLLEDCNSYFISALDQSEEAKAYLQSRGYTDEDLKAMELGYMVSYESLGKWLLSQKGYTHILGEEKEGFISETFTDFKSVKGMSNRITIPFRSGGSIKGFKFRTITDQTPKYLNTTGLDKSGGFFNLLGIKGDKDVVIVEGELDSLHATVKGVENVVATGGSSISSEQIKDAVRRGAKSFSICFDTEPGKEETRDKNILSAIGVIQGTGVNRVYIVNLPDLGGGKTDPDRLIKERGIEAFKEALKTRLNYGAWIGAKLFNSLKDKVNEAGELDYKDRDLLREQIVQVRSQLSAQDRIDFNRILEPLQPYGFTEDILKDLEEDHKTAIEEANRNKRVDDLLRRAGQLQNKGEVIKTLKEGIKDIDAVTGKGLLPDPMSFSALLVEIAKMPPAYKTGYRSLDKIIGFTPGAITLIAGRPSHGKTTFMFNLLLQMSKIYQSERFYFFTYEEPVKNISVKLLNRLIDTDLSGYFREIKDLAKPTNYEFIKSYIRAGRTDIASIEEGKRYLQDLMDSQRITVIGRNYSVEDLSSLVAYINRKEQIGALFIDYIQRMNTQRKTQDKKTEIAHISDQVLQIAKDSGLPIILGAQLNRDATKGGGEPKLEYLKEAGNLEEDANTVISVYCEAREKEEIDGQQTSKQKVVDLKVKTLKNREGEVNASEVLDWDRYTGVIKDKSNSGGIYFMEQE